MPKKSHYYEFNGLRFFPEFSLLEVLESGKKINPSPKHCGFLLTLLKNPKKTVTYDELRETVWAHQTTADEFFIRNIHSTKNNLIKQLKAIGVKTDFIKSIPGKGYFLDAIVSEELETNGAAPEIINADLHQANLLSGGTDKSTKALEHLPMPNNLLYGRHLAYISFSSFSYSLLFWLALVLEIAYQFDSFGTMALSPGLPLMFWIAATTFVGLTWTQHLVQHGSGKALFVGLSFFVCGAIGACLAISYFLPNEPITLARFQSQTAFAAFLKNSLIYFLPLGVVFILIPFHFVCVQQYELSRNYDFPIKSSSFIPNKGSVNLRPSFLFGVWSLIVVYSIFSTFYLLDNLLVGKYHNLFVTVTFLRFFVYFSLGLVCLVWYKSQGLQN